MLTRLLAVPTLVALGLAAPAAASTFSFSATNADTLTTTPTAYTINQPDNGGAGSGLLESNFSTPGDFTASVTQTANSAGTEQQIAAFEVQFAGGGETVQYLVINGGGQPLPPLWGYSITPPASAYGVDPVTGHFQVNLGLQRSGDTLTFLYDGAAVASATNAAFDGAATYFLYFENGNGDSHSGFARWSNFTIASAAPEPASWAMMLLGLSGIGSALRGARRKRIFATVSARPPATGVTIKARL